MHFLLRSLVGVKIYSDYSVLLNFGSIGYNTKSIICLYYYRLGSILIIIRCGR